MNQIDAYRLARAEMAKHPELASWTFRFDNGQRRLGVCRPKQKQIGLSRSYVSLNTDELILDTIRHEIAHALDWERNKKAWHGWTWRAICREIGARPERYKPDAVVAHKYNLVVKPSMEVVGRYHRLPNWATNGSLSRRMVIGRPETRGNLMFVLAK